MGYFALLLYFEKTKWRRLQDLKHVENLALRCVEINDLHVISYSTH